MCVLLSIFNMSLKDLFCKKACPKVKYNQRNSPPRLFKSGSLLPLLSMKDYVRLENSNLSRPIKKLDAANFGVSEWTSKYTHAIIFD